MTHDELLARIGELSFVDELDMTEEYLSVNALRAVVKRHKPWINLEGKTVCAECCNYGAETYPCVTIKDIQEELK